MKLFRTYFMTGLLLAFCILAIKVIGVFVFESVDSVMRPGSTAMARVLGLVGEHEKPARWVVVMLDLVLAIGGVVALGALARSLLGRKLVAWGAHIAERLPVVRSIYPKIRDAIGIMHDHEGDTLRKFVLVQQNPGNWLPGFVTGEGKWKDGDEEIHYVIVYLPSNHLVSGGVRVVRRERVRYLDMSVDEGMTALLTAGLTLEEHLVEA